MEIDRIRNNTVTVILDTNFILSCLRFGIDFQEIDVLIGKKYELFVPSNVIYELKNIKLGGRDSILRKVALEIIDRYHVLALRGDVDTSILEFSRENNCVVCTNDRELRSSLRKRGIPVIFIRSKNHLELNGAIF
ncbi:MAG: hypothetical protein U9N35_02180 [Euryarchaeota archaeon]|nr:hypothetical protein [Euryarchaeota archaeon]